MRIGFIGQKGIPATYGGVERHTEELAVNLAASGHDVSVYTRSYYTDRSLKSYKGVRLINIPTIPTKHLDAIFHTFLACLDTFRRDFDIIHFHSIGPASLLWLAKLLNPRKIVIATFHTQCYRHQKWGGFARWYLKFGEWVCCRLADRVIVISRDLEEYTRKKYGIDPEFMPNGVAEQTRVKPDAIKDKWGLAANGYILSVSRLVRHKGIHYAIEAFKRVDTNKRLVIVGAGFHTKDYVKELESLAAGDDRIIFTGMQSGRILQELFSSAAFFIQPSESEGLSIALLEAMAYGKSVLASDIPENQKVVSQAGFLFRSKDIGDLKTKMEYLLANPGLTESTGQAAKIHVQSEYNWKAIVMSLDKLYQEVSGNSKQKKSV